eukprot:2679773-Amphidinium_carterae.5
MTSDLIYQTLSLDFFYGSRGDNTLFHDSISQRAGSIRMIAFIRANAFSVMPVSDGQSLAQCRLYNELLEWLVRVDHRQQVTGLPMSTQCFAQWYVRRLHKSASDFPVSTPYTCHMVLERLTLSLFVLHTRSQYIRTQFCRTPDSVYVTLPVRSLCHSPPSIRM